MYESPFGKLINIIFVTIFRDSNGMEFYRVPTLPYFIIIGEVWIKINWSRFSFKTKEKKN